MITTFCPENNNSFAVDDWNTIGVSGQGIFTSADPIQRAPKRLVSFAWSLVFSLEKAEQATPAQEFRAAIDSLFEHSMTKKEAAYFRRELASGFVPLTPEQTRLLPPRANRAAARRTMPPLLQAAEFLPEDLSSVAGFACGSQPWEAAMSEWIKKPPTARFGNSKYETSIWLYHHPDGRVVGFGSLGLTRWTDPYPSGRWIDLSIIPALAIQTEFQHVPHHRNDEGYPTFSHQIVGDLLGKALLQSPDFVVLCVHRENSRAIALYKHFGFKFVPGPDQIHRRMQRRLR